MKKLIVLFLVCAVSLTTYAQNQFSSLNCNEVTVLYDFFISEYDIRKNEVVVTSISDNEDIYFIGNPVTNLEDLEAYIYERIINANSDCDLPKVYFKEITTPSGLVNVRGTVYYPIISIAKSINHNGQLVQTTTQVYMRVINALREQFARQYFGVSYMQLNDEYKQTINDLFPGCIFVEKQVLPPLPPVL